MLDTPLNVFICYAREDRPELNQLMGHLAVFERNGSVRFWYDKESTGGKDWDEEIHYNLKSADIVLLLISPDFFQSNYIHSVELTEALRRDRDKEALVVPVILKKCLWNKHKELARLQALPSEAKPVFEESCWRKPDDGFFDVAEGFDRILEDPETRARRARKMVRREVEAAEQHRMAEEKRRRQLKEAARLQAEAAEQKRREEEATLQTLASQMVFVQGGTFTIGGVKGRDGGGYDVKMPAHEVMVKDFYIGKYPVTQKQWLAVMGSSPSYRKGCDDCPVEGVSWNDIQEFLKKFNAMIGKRYRLPTEAEWEYAARGGKQSKGYLYSGSNNVNEVAWYSRNSVNKTQPVGTMKPNELGLYDMSGNVWEWCEDDWHANYMGAPVDGSAWVDNPQRGAYRVLRGGSWGSNSEYCRVSGRDRLDSSERISLSGFRLALVP